MAIEAQKKLSNYGLINNYFVLKNLNTIDKTCCDDCVTAVIDFDNTKEKIVEKYGWTCIKSCDALIIYDSKEGIDFIEMKSGLSIIKNPKIKSENKLIKQVESFDFSSKIHDSLTILNSICNEKGSTLTGTERKKIRTIKKQYIILTDINITHNPLEFLTLSLDHLATFSSKLTILLSDAIDKIDSDSLQSISKPILMDCTTFKKYITN